MIAPSGAPMKNNIMHANEIANLSFNEMMCLLIFLSLYAWIILLDFIMLFVLLTELIAKSKS